MCGESEGEEEAGVKFKYLTRFGPMVLGEERGGGGGREGWSSMGWPISRILNYVVVAQWLSPRKLLYLEQVADLTFQIYHIKLIILSNQVASF